MDADLVFAIGPKLALSAKDKVASKQSQPVVEIIPGLPEIHGIDAPSVFSAITFGRLTPETDLIKQASLAVASFSKAKGITHSPLRHDSRLTVIGLSQESSDKEHIALLNLAQQYAHRAVPINAFPYTDERSRLFDELRHHSACMMLSLHEGFGLTGWEAIAAEVPLVLTTNSGLFEAIDNLAGGPGVGCIFPVDVRGYIGDPPFEEVDLHSVADALLRIASNPTRAKNNARALKMLLSEVCTWRHAAVSVANACNVDVALEPRAELISTRWQPHKLLDALLHSKGTVEQMARRHKLFEQLWTALQAPHKIQKRVILFGGIATALCNQDAAGHYAHWLMANPSARLFVCYETGAAAAVRARKLGGTLETASGLPADPVERMEAKARRVEALPTFIEQELPAKALAKVMGRVHLIPLCEPLTTYIVLTDDDITITPLFEARSTETMSFSISNNSPTFRQDVLRFIIYHLRVLENSESVQVLLQELMALIEVENLR